ncbi:MAG: SRPBCC family protein [Actinomycetota bacterium]
MATLETRPAEWIDKAPVKVRASREIHASADEVWAVLVDHARWPEWFTALDEAGPTGGEGLGSTRFVRIGKATVNETFIIWDEPHAFGFTVDDAEGPLGRIASSLNERIETQVLSPDRVRVTYLMGFQPRPRTKLLLRFASRQLTRNLRVALAGLEAQIETRRGA